MAIVMDSFLTLPGDQCFTPAEALKHKDRINRLGLNLHVTDISGVSIHYTHLKQSDIETKSKVGELLASGAETALAPADPNSRIYYVTPRTISPWSSKATSIAHVCGLKSQVSTSPYSSLLLILSLHVKSGFDAASSANPK
jgi:phosphoribosylformylglycinamidine synthase